MNWRRVCLWLFAGLLPLTGWAQGRAQVRLLLDATTVPPGAALMGALELSPPQGWHTYWRNSGESGQATRVRWTLPPGVEAGELQWPAPEAHVDAGLTTYVHEGRVLLPVRFTIASDAAPGPLEIVGRVQWLECDKECIPGRMDVTNRVMVGSPAVASPARPAIEQAVAGLPRPDPSVRVSAAWAGAASGDERSLEVIVGSDDGRELTGLFPYEDPAAVFGPATLPAAGARGPATLRMVVTQNAGEWPGRVSGVLGFRTGTPVEFSVPIESGASSVTTASGSTGAGSVDVVTRSLWTMLGLAFVGGMILNIMPCVLPVIALKVLGFVKQSRENPGRVRFLGMIYSVGVLCSFAVLAGLVIAVQGAGRAASWGMQFQNPVFLVAITTLVTVVALNLFGVFEVSLAAGAADAASGLASRGGASGAFFNGVFATILATPCTAPFLGVALGFAFGQPPLLLLLLFLTVGAGLAAPYLLLSLQPGWLRFLPKPGNWMITFKVLMGFPMLATGLWLLSLAPDHFGSKGVFWLGMFLLCVAIAAWLYGRSIQMGQGNRKLAWIGIVTALAVGVGFILERELQWRSPPPVTSSSKGGVSVSGGIAWSPWSPEAVEIARGEGRPVLVDFTASWCITCQSNKRLAIEIPEVAALVRSLNVATLRGDYTVEDPAITAELRRFGRAGVPLVLVFPRDPAGAPRVLPELLTPSIVIEALEWAAAAEGPRAAVSK
ncbi:MAG: thioredoxin family protein [Verrucomicrobiae bacterium]|nr:thioredoxin family protein [Verrucomicrobiae bacterium]